MLFLEELGLRENSWKDFDQKLEDNKFAPIIYNNSIVNNKQKECLLSSEQVGYYKSSFKIADLAIAGASHGYIIGPLMSLSFSIDSDSARLTEYLTYEHDNSGIVSDATIIHDLSNLAIYLSFFNKNIRYVNMPVIIENFKNDVCRLDLCDDMCILTIL